MPKRVIYGITSKIGYGLTTTFGPGPARRNIAGTGNSRPTVIAVGGNSFEGLEEATAKNIVTLSRNNRVVITHGNGPQVGKKLEEAEEQGIVKGLNTCIQETQIEMGETLKENLHREVDHFEINPTRVYVDPNDPAFKNPTKYIGREFPLKKFESIAQRREDGLYDWKEGDTSWTMKEVPGKSGTFRRVVASPKPIKIHSYDLLQIETWVYLNKTAVALGGGGVPLFPDGSPAEAVIDKDLATALLCRELHAQSLVISTGVTYVAHNFREPNQKDILYYQLKHALRNLKRGQYPAGAMGEKIEAAINALRFGVNEVLITHPQASWIKGEGTMITRGTDLTGRFYNLARLLHMRSEDLQRWMVI